MAFLRRFLTFHSMIGALRKLCIFHQKAIFLQLDSEHILNASNQLIKMKNCHMTTSSILCQTKRTCQSSYSICM
jgi:hypothetical protein